MTFAGVVPSPDLQLAARALDALQEGRNEADYDLGQDFTRGRALDLVTLAEEAFAAWSRIRRSEEADLYLLALLIRRRLDR